MSSDTLKVRVERLEHRVEILEQLPGRVSALESQIVRLREEMHSEFSAMQTVIRDGDEETRRYLRMLHEDLIRRIATLAEGR